MPARKLRLGIDVGGTFTDVVAVDADVRDVVARVKVPTTHRASEGVARGIIDGIAALLAQSAVAPDDVVFIAHSTTQATNALLEGDVARVGVLGLLDATGALSRRQMQFGRLELAPGVPFETRFAFARVGHDKHIEERLQALQAGGVQAIAVSQAFGVDRPRYERAAAHQARARGLYATCGHEVSSMYGLRARTRTAAINAAILPKMVRTAEMTSQAVERAAITAPLMIMRSDGGVMDVREMERRPILTMLSGPAAGVAGALLHEHLTDGIFVEVGGTSADCSAIRAGMPQMRPARVGGHRTMLRTLDVRTLAIAGGSMARADDAGIIDVGPRSAHIAGLEYAAFVSPQMFESARVERIRPTPHDPPDYVVLRARDGTGIALTPTCAANMLSEIPSGAFARGDSAAAQRGFELLGAHLHADPAVLARSVLDIASNKLIAAVRELIADYELDVRTLTIVGGGGGAGALVPYTAARMHIDVRIARDAEVLSPIGVALALVREVVERTMVQPTAQDVVRIRREAQDAVIAAGAAPETVEVAVEIDTQRSMVRASASGASEMTQAAATAQQSDAQLRESAERLLHAPPGQARLLASTPALVAFGYNDLVRILDRHGVGRLTLLRPRVHELRALDVPEMLPRLIEAATAFGDVGRALPDVYLAHGARIADLRGLAGAEQASALADEELAGRSPDAVVVVFVVAKAA